jgi:thiamine pyrophosphokinase
MKAFIYTGGSINKQNITEQPKAGDLCIAADSGYTNALALGVKVDILLGDMDSIDRIPKNDDKFEILRVPAEKDFTDTQLAVNTALERGADDIVIIGGLGGRLDHTMSNLGVLTRLWNLKVHAYATDGYNRIRYLDSTSTLIPKSGFTYLSLIAVSDKLKGVSIDGCKYPLKNATVCRDDQFAVSNEIQGNCALISVRKGACYVIESI